MSPSLWLPVGLAALALGLGCAVMLLVATIRLCKSSARLETHSATGRHARTAFLSILGIVVAAIAVVWTYWAFITVKGQVP